MELAGFGADYFKDKFYVYIVDAADAAPEEELELVTAYSTADGVFTTNAFTMNVEANDEIYLVHESLATLFSNFDSSGVVNNFDGSLMEVLKSGLEQTTGGAYDPDTDSNEAISESLNGTLGVLHEQAAVPMSFNASSAGEVDVFDLTVASTQYEVRSVRLKSADPLLETITVRLYELVNDGEVMVNDFDITTLNFVTYYSLMDMFGVNTLAGNNLRIAVISSGAANVAITAQYNHAKTNV